MHITSDQKKVETITTLTLTFNEDELLVFRAILQNVGGHPDTTHRSMLDCMLKEIGDLCPETYNMGITKGEMQIQPTKSWNRDAGSFDPFGM